MDNLANCPQVSFTVVNSENIDGPHITTFYESAIAFGKASVIQNQEKPITDLENHSVYPSNMRKLRMRLFYMAVHPEFLLTKLRRTQS